MQERMRTALARTVGTAAMLLLAACGAAAPDEQPLRIGMIPDAGATRASVAEKQPLEEYLSAALGRDVQLIIPTNYNATVEALGNGSLDIAYLGGLTFVKAQQRYGAVPLVQRTIDQQFHSVFITKRGSGIDSLEDLAGRSFCFGDVNSTSGNLMPRFVLKQAGVPAEKLAETRQTGSHPATAQGVAEGACDAGAMDETVYRQLVADGQLGASEVHIFHTSPPFADYVWAAAESVSEEDRQAFSRAMLALKRGKDDAVLDILRGDSFVTANGDDYADVETTARELDLL